MQPIVRPLRYAAQGSGTDLRSLKLVVRSQAVRAEPRCASDRGKRTEEQCPRLRVRRLA
jgi:hypothetical protein